jgi:type I restriction enzyme S subunit
MSFPSYPSYKDSGVKWLGEVPEQWSTSSVRWLARRYSGGTPDKTILSYWEDGTVPWLNSGAVNDKIIKEPSTYISLEAFENSSAKWIPAGSLVMALAGQGRTKGMVAQLAIPTTCNQSMAAIIPGPEINPKFLFWWLESNYQNIRNMAGGDLRDGLNLELLGDIRCPLPTHSEQNIIATFLDSETERIDALVAEQLRLMELLKEKRQAVISHAVTKGLNPNVPLKSTGVEWLGDVPEHWELRATKRLFRLIVEPAPDDNDYELLSIYTEIGVRPRKDLEAKGNKATTTDGYWMVQKGDLIVNKLLAWMGAIGISEYDGVTSPAYDILRQRVPLEPQFYDFLFRCGICFSEFRRYSRGIMDMRLRLYFDELGQLVMPYPPKEEQRVIVDFLTGELARFDALSDEAQRAVDLLQERRSALISAAVTGQIDVRPLSGRETA